MRRRIKIQHVFEELHFLELAYHPFVENMVYSFQSAESVYFVIEYCAGGDFSRTLQKQPEKSIFEAAAQFYASEVLLALEYLHQMGCIYRDLKPENILVHLSGRIMLTDFDLSKFVTALPLGPDHANPLARRVRVDSFVGTPEYMAPEVISGQLQSEAVDWSSSRCSTGILLFVGNRSQQRSERSTERNLNSPANPRYLKLPRMLFDPCSRGIPTSGSASRG